MNFFGSARQRSDIMVRNAASPDSVNYKRGGRQKAIADIRRSILDMLRVRIDRDVEVGLLPSGTPSAALAGLVLAVTQGMSVLARNGASRAALLAIVDVALRAWPPSMVGDEAS